METGIFIKNICLILAPELVLFGAQKLAAVDLPVSTIVFTFTLCFECVKSCEM